MNGIYEKNIASSGVEYFRGTASFLNSKSVQTSEGVVLEADHIMIASGSYPAIP